MKPLRVLVVGTGTDVGKTHLSQTVLQSAVASGARALGLKPIESGRSSFSGSDAERLQLAGNVAGCLDAPYIFEPPVSPHLAARQVGRTIEVATVVSWVDDAPPADLLLIETAGGLLSPLGGGLSNLDLVEPLRPDVVILATVDLLGVLHGVDACRRLLLPRLPIVALGAPAAGDSSTGSNAAEIALLYGLDVVPVPRGAPSLGQPTWAPRVRSWLARSGPALA